MWPYGQRAGWLARTKRLPSSSSSQKGSTRLLVGASARRDARYRRLRAAQTPRERASTSAATITTTTMPTRVSCVRQLDFVLDTRSQIVSELLVVLFVCNRVTMSERSRGNRSFLQSTSEWDLFKCQRAGVFYIPNINTECYFVLFFTFFTFG